MNEYDLNKRQVESLIKSGAFDGLGTRRSQLIASFEEILDGLHEKKRKSVAGQLDMFAVGDSDEGEKAPEFSYPDIPEYSRKRLLELEKQVSGMYFSGHILDDYEKELSLIIPYRVSDIKVSADDREANENAQASFSDKDRVTLAGLVTKRTVKETRRGDKMMFITLEDKTGDIEVVVFPKQLERFSSLFYGEDPVVIKGELSIEEEQAPKVLCSFASGIAEAAARAESVNKNDGEPLTPSSRIKKNERVSAQNSPASRLYIRVNGVDTVEYKRALALVHIFCGELPVFVYDVCTGKYARLESCGADPASRRLISELSRLLGEENVVLK